MNDYSHIKRYPSLADAKEAYYKGLDLHEKLVKEAFEKYGKLFADTLGVDVSKLEKLIEVHDQSKRTVEDEINGFMANRYPYEGDGIDDDHYGLRHAIYEKGLLSHYHNNPHHPEFWVFIKAQDWTLDAKPMDSIYICEMLIDWVAYQNMLQLRTVEEYWTHIRSTLFMHPHTVEQVDLLVTLVSEMQHKEHKEVAGE